MFNYENDRLYLDLFKSLHSTLTFFYPIFTQLANHGEEGAGISAPTQHSGPTHKPKKKKKAINALGKFVLISKLGVERHKISTNCPFQQTKVYEEPF